MFTHMETSLYQRRASNFDLCCELLSIEQWRFLSVLHYGVTFIIVISGDQWHLHLLPSVWQWSCHNLHARRTPLPYCTTAAVLGLEVLGVIKIIEKQHIKKKHTQKGNNDINHFTYRNTSIHLEKIFNHNNNKFHWCSVYIRFKDDLDSTYVIMLCKRWTSMISAITLSRMQV